MFCTKNHDYFIKIFLRVEKNKIKKSCIKEKLNSFYTGLTFRAWFMSFEKPIYLID
jgi:hypothetical protein